MLQSRMTEDSEINARVRTYVKEQWNALSSPSSERGQKIEALKNIALLLPSSRCTTHPLFATSNALNKAREMFINNHYATFGGNLINLFSVDWLSPFPRETIQDVIDNFYLKGVPHEVLPLLCSAISNSGPSYRQGKCVHLLEEVLKGETLNLIFLDQVDKPAEISEGLLNVISSLPDKMANALKEQNCDLFLPANYIRLISSSLLSSMEKCHRLLLDGMDCSLEFCSQLLGKICLGGYSELLWKHLLPALLGLVKQGYLWCRLCERLITGSPDRCVESVIIPVLIATPWYGQVQCLLGDCVVHHRKIRYLLCTKLLLMRYFEQTLLLQNVIGYLASSSSRKSLFKSCLLNVLGVWVDGSAIKRTSYQQHYYLSKALLISLAFIKAEEVEDYQECLSMLMRGMEHHLGSSDPKIRALGMIVAENFTKKLQPHGPQLTFQVTEDEASKELLSLLTPPKNPESETTPDEFSVSELSGLTLDDGKHTEKTATGQAGDTGANEELDSDDDLEPYDMSNDVKVTKVLTPHYIRDCMEGLIKPESPDQMEVCLRSAERLIRSNPDGLAEISVEFMKILLHLADEDIILEFSPLRSKAMVALTCQCPAQVAPYLTTEFYGENYNLRQRLDVLEVLSRAAQELSAPAKVEGSKTHRFDDNPVVETTAECSSWREIVQRRIEKKTKRFAKGRRQPEPVTSLNKFSPVAGLFFFPLLLQYDRKQNTLDLLGRDSLVLSRLIYTLGVVIHAAVNTPILRQMGATGLEFIWALRYHGDGSVRLSILFTCAMLFLSVPTHILLTDLQHEVTEMKSWLQDVTQTDVDTECRELALQVLVLLDGLVTEELQTGTRS